MRIPSDASTVQGEGVTIKEHWAEVGYELGGEDVRINTFMLRWFHALYYHEMDYEEMVKEIRG